MTANMYGVSFGGDKHVLKLIVVMVAQPCEYTKKHGVELFTQVNCVVC